jgi:hypothetical protein
VRTLCRELVEGIGRLQTVQVATWEDVARLALAMPETSEGQSYGNTAWKVKDKGFVWERPLGKADLLALGDTAPPEGPILAVRVDGLAEKEAVLAANPDCCFTIPHFNGYPAVLILLDRIDEALLTELVIDAWLARAPKRLTDQYLHDHRRG